MSDESREKLKEIFSEIPARKKTAERFRRLHDLARQAPFASASEDFLELMDREIKTLEAQVDFAETMQGVLFDNEGGLK